MRWVRLVAQSVEKENVESVQPFHGRFRNLAEVSKVSRRAEAVTDDRRLAMDHSDGLEGHSENRNGLGDLDEIHFGESAEFVVRVEDVLKDLTKNRASRVIRVERNLWSAGHSRESEWTKIIKPENVVGVSM